MRYAEYEVVSINGMMLKISIVTFGKSQFKVKIKVEAETYICIIPVKHFLS